MAAEVKYHSGPAVQDTNDSPLRVLRGDAVVWVQVGNSERLRPMVLTTDQLVHLAYKCLEILNARRAR